MVALSATPPGFAQQSAGPQDGWEFKFKDFLIGAWYGPYARESEVQLYKDAGFNVVMTGRYMNGDRVTITEEMAAAHLDLAQRFGLAAMFDTYVNTSWGRSSRIHGHHPSTLAELQWLQARFGDHPAIIGFLIGDDQNVITPRLADCTDFMRERCPQLMPWICQNLFTPEALVGMGNPIANWQMYPTLYQTHLTAPRQMAVFSDQLFRLRDDTVYNQLIMWPMFNVVGVGGDSVVRYQVYASLAYGSQGIWYFHYKGGLRGNSLRPPLRTYDTASEANHRVAGWGPELLGRESVQLFSTGWAIRGSSDPAPGEWVEQMSDSLLVGILTKKGQAPLAMVVDKRVSKRWRGIQPRQVNLRFGPKVKRLELLEGAAAIVSGREIELELAGGDGQLLRLVDPTPHSLRAQAVSAGRVQLDFSCDAPTRGHWVYISLDGMGFSDSLYVQEEAVTIDGLRDDTVYYFAVRSESELGPSARSTVVAATASTAAPRALIVNGSGNGYVYRHAAVLHGLGYTIATTAPVLLTEHNGEIGDYALVDWFSGDRRSNVLSSHGQRWIRNYLDGGGNLLLSGSRIGEAMLTSGSARVRSFHRDYLRSDVWLDDPDVQKTAIHKRLLAAPGTLFEGLPPLEFGGGTEATFDVGIPNIFRKNLGSTFGLSIDAEMEWNRGALVYYEGPFGASPRSARLVYMTVPFESIYPRAGARALMARIAGFLDPSRPTHVVSSTVKETPTPEAALTATIYPNPFNSSTTVQFTTAVPGRVTVSVYDLRGQLLAKPLDEWRPAGSHVVSFDGRGISSGVYFCAVQTAGRTRARKMLLLR